MKRKWIQLLAVLLAVLICFPVIPAFVYAEPSENESGQTETGEGEGSREDGENNQETEESGAREGGPEGPQDDTRYVTAENWPQAPVVEAEGAVLMDAITGTVLYEKNANHTYYPASITKIMTGLLAAEHCSLDEVVTYSHDAVYTVPVGYANIAAVEGEQMTVEDCIYALLLPSANDAANALGEHISGSIEAFSQMMNERAAQLGAKHTHFVNPSGIHNEEHWTTPYDMAMIMRGCALNETFMQIDSAQTYVLPPTQLQEEERPMANLHRMLFPAREEYYEYVLGGKTGYTTPAGNTLVTYAEKGDMKLVCVVMHSMDATYEDTKVLLEYGFNNFRMYQPAQTDDRYTLESNGFFEDSMEEDRQASIEFQDGGWVILPQNVSFFDTEPELTYVNNEDSQSDVFADLTYYYQGMEVGQASLRLITAADEAFDFDQHPAEGRSAGQVESIPETLAGQNDKSVILINVWYVAAGVGFVVLSVLSVVFIKKFNSERNQNIRLYRKRRKFKFKSDKKLKF